MILYLFYFQKFFSQLILFWIHPLDCNISFKVQVPMYFESTEFTRISSIEPLAGCKVKKPQVPKTTKATTFPQNIKCNVPGIYCVTIRYLFCLVQTPEWSKTLSSYDIFSFLNLQMNYFLAAHPLICPKQIPLSNYRLKQNFCPP